MVQPNCNFGSFKVTMEEYYFNFYFIFDKSAKKEERLLSKSPRSEMVLRTGEDTAQEEEKKNRGVRIR